MHDGNPLQASARARCAARSKRSGKGCQNAPCTGSTKCRMHGGKSEGRPLKHGRYSQRLPAAVRAAYESNLTDPTLLEARQTLSLLDSIAQLQAERIEDGDGPTFRAEAMKLVGRYQVELGKENGNPREALRALFDHIESGDARMRAEMDLFELVERYDKRASEATKIELSKQNALPASKLEDLVQVLAAGVKELAPEVAEKIMDHWARALGPVSHANRLGELARN